jgi:ABC-2 type transport system ATP-binding protein
MTSDYAIDVYNLNKSFDHLHVVRDVSLKVEYGEIFGFLGPNGSGKTTTIRMMCGLLTPDSGSGTCLGYDIITQSGEIKRHVGYMTQRFSMWDDLTIRENLNFVACMYGLKNRRERVDQALDLLGLQQESSKLVKALSGGWKQRMALAACMLHDPKLLLLDEPTAGVDPKARREFWEELYKLAAKGISVLVSTHYMDEAERCHKLAYIFDGEVIAKGDAATIIKDENIVTYSIRGDALMRILDELVGKNGVDQILPFGSLLHVSGSDPAALEATLAEFRKNNNCQIDRIETSLEDVFIHLMKVKHRTTQKILGG